MRTVTALAELSHSQGEGEGTATLRAVLYVADESNDNYLGPAPTEHIARTIAVSVGALFATRQAGVRLLTPHRPVGTQHRLPAWPRSRIARQQHSRSACA